MACSKNCAPLSSISLRIGPGTGLFEVLALPTVGQARGRIRELPACLLPIASGCNYFKVVQRFNYSFANSSLHIVVFVRLPSKSAFIRDTVGSRNAPAPSTDRLDLDPPALEHSYLLHSHSSSSHYTINYLRFAAFREMMSASRLFGSLTTGMVRSGTVLHVVIRAIERENQLGPGQGPFRQEGAVLRPPLKGLLLLQAHATDAPHDTYLQPNSLLLRLRLLSAACLRDRNAPVMCVTPLSMVLGLDCSTSARHSGGRMEGSRSLEQVLRRNPPKTGEGYNENK